MEIKTKQLSGLFLCFFVAFLSCQTPKKQESNVQESNILKNTTRYAKGFDILKKDGQTFVRVFRPFNDKNDTITYVLVQKGQKISKKTSKMIIVEVPAQRWLVTSTTHIGFLEALQSENMLVGATCNDYVYSEKVQKRIDDKKITAFNGQDLAIEAVMSLQPNLMMLSGGASQDYAKYQKMIDLGVPIVVNSEWLENSPLGKAEWIKFVGVFLGQEEQAEHIFENIEKQYLAYQKLVVDVAKKPSVLTGMAYKGTWYMAGGKSFMAQFIKDAGGQYLWAENTDTGSFPLSLEQVYDKANNADIWLNLNVSKKIEVEQADKRYADFKPYKEDKLYNLKKRISKNGGNDLWESGVVNPHLILADLIKIFHPEKLPKYDLYFHDIVGK